MPVKREIEKIRSRVPELEGREKQRNKIERTQRTQKRALTERVKELNCLYNISKIFGRKDFSMDEIILKLIKVLLPAWQYTDLASVRIELDRKSYVSSGYRLTPWKIKENLSVFGKCLGFVEICYREKPTKKGVICFVPAERKLLKSVSELIGSLIEQKESQKSLEESEKKLRAQKAELERKNIALTEVLAHIEVEKKDIQHNIVSSIEKLIMPIVQKLMVKTMDQETVKKYAEMLKSNLDELTSPFAKMIVDEQAKLSPREFEICTLVKNGLSSKEIAQLLHVSVLTVERHRHNIRKKLGLAKEKLNLQTFLRHL